MKKLVQVLAVVMLLISTTTACAQKTIGDVMNEKMAEITKNLNVEILNCGYDSGTYPLIEITNNNEFLVNVFVDLAAVDTDGTILNTTKILETVPAGRKAIAEGFITDAYYNSTCEITNITAYEK